MFSYRVKKYLHITLVPIKKNDMYCNLMYLRVHAFTSEVSMRLEKSDSK